MTDREQTRRDAEPKICRSCGKGKSRLDFNVRREAKDGLQTYCRDCQATLKRRQREVRPDSTVRDPAVMRDHRKRWIEANREKRRAQRAVQAKVRRGLMVRPDRCESCDRSVPVHAHHDDHSRRFDVRWLCARCHRRLEAA